MKDLRREIRQEGARWLVEHFDGLKLVRTDRCGSYPQALVCKYRGLGQAQAAKVYRWCKGTTDLDTLREVADEALCKAAAGFDPTRRGLDSGELVSFAPYARVWAYRECMAIARRDWDRPWLESDDERVSDEDILPWPDLDPVDASRVREVVQALPLPLRHIASLWGHGHDDKEVCRMLDLTPAEGLPLLGALRETLRRKLAALREEAVPHPAPHGAARGPTGHQMALCAAWLAPAPAAPAATTLPEPPT